MIAADLIAVFREEADDQKLPYLWKEASVLRFLHAAQVEAARRARLFLDSDTPSVTRVRLGAGQSVAKLDPRVIYVRRARLVGQELLLCPIYRRDMDCQVGWEDEPAGIPRRLIRDWSTQVLKVYPKADQGYMIALTVVREPLDEITDPGQNLEIAGRYQMGLRHWMLHLAFSKRDSGGDARDDKLAVYYAKQFAEEFGERVNAQNEVWEAQQEDVLAEQGGSY